MKRFVVYSIIFVAILAAPSGAARAHAFPEHAEPGAGAELDRSPEAVTVRFDRAVEPVFSALRVENEAGERMDADGSQIIHGRNDTLMVTLKPLLSGRYHVFWTAVARDGHRTHGDYWFTVHQP